MSRLITLTAIFVALFASAGTCRAVDSATTITQVTRVLNGGNYDITATGTVTLGTGDTYIGTMVTLKKPDGTIVGMFLNLTPPAAGATANYTATVGNQAAATGNWKFTISMSYTHLGQNKVSTTFVEFTVP